MGTELFRLLGTDAEDPRVQAAVEDAKDAERLVDTLVAMRRDTSTSQADVAERMETTQSSVSKFERAGGDPRLSTLQRYARAVGARLRWTVASSARESEMWRETRYPVPGAVDPDPADIEDGPAVPWIRLVS